MSEWISVEDAVPETDDKVLAWCPEEFRWDTPIVFARYNPKLSHAWRPEGTNGGPWNVTYWQPLPPPPEETSK